MQAYKPSVYSLILKCCQRYKKMAKIKAKVNKPVFGEWPAKVSVSFLTSPRDTCILPSVMFTFRSFVANSDFCKACTAPLVKHQHLNITERRERYFVFVVVLVILKRSVSFYVMVLSLTQLHTQNKFPVPQS